jgi:Domain of unknown function (DUF4190)
MSDETPQQQPGPTGPPPGPGGYPGQPGPGGYPGQPPAGYGVPGYPYGVYQPPMNTYAILSLVLGIAVLPPLGIYFGYQARKQIAVTGERGSELATAGIVIGWVLSSIFAAFILLWCGVMSISFLPLLLIPAAG